MNREIRQIRERGETAIKTNIEHSTSNIEHRTLKQDREIATEDTKFTKILTTDCTDDTDEDGKT
jgi:hypothetical protein